MIAHRISLCPISMGTPEKWRELRRPSLQWFIVCYLGILVYKLALQEQSCSTWLKVPVYHE